MVRSDLAVSLRRLADLFHRKDYPAMLEEALVAVSVWPETARCWDLLGVAYLSLGQLDSAQAAFVRAYTLAPQDADVLAHWGVVLKGLGKCSEALVRLQEAHHINPQDPSHLSNMGNVCMDLRRFSDAEKCFNAALERAPDYADALNNLGSCLQAQGRMLEALTQYEKALALSPTSPTVLSNIILTSGYRPDVTLGQLKQLALRYGQAVSPSSNSFGEVASTHAERPISRIGFVSADLHRHPVGYFLESTVAALARRGLSLFFYSTNAYQDDLSQRLQAQASSWVSLVGQSDEQAVRRIRADQLDVLVDLAGHTGGNRLPIFARRAAPLQVSWLGYFGTTGVQAMDGLLADTVSVPAEDEGGYTERVVRLAGGRLCFTPPDLALPVWSAADDRRPFTFASFSNLAKINAQVIDIWAVILKAAPSARLLVQNKQMDDAAQKAALLSAFEQRGVDARQVTLEGLCSREDYLRAYQQVDLVLDTFPFPGGTTTCEALWMGVPTLTLAGQGLLGRQGASLMHSAGLSDWVTENLRDYQSKAIERWRLGILPYAERQRLRNTFLGSPLCDAERMATALLDAFEELRNYGKR